MIRKIFLVFILMISSVIAEETQDSKQWKKFFGIEGGVGVFGINSGFIFSGNSLFNTGENTLGLGYSAGISGGWQKYTYEKVGIRNTFGFAFSYSPNISSIRKSGKYQEFCFLFCKNAKEYDYNNNRAQHYDLYYALDGLFAFVKNGENRFGMIFGFSLNLSVGASQGVNDNLNSFTAFFGSRIGLYTQFEDDILDLTLKFPIGGFGGDNVNVTALTFGYKHLF